MKPINKKTTSSRGRSLPVLATGRSCGPCHACCVFLDVEDEGVAHKRGERCPALDEKGRCSSYDARPDTCRDFSCLWLTGFGDDVADRPDQLGIILHAMPPSEEAPGVIPIAATELRAGVLDDAKTRAAETVKAIAFQMPVIGTRVDGTKFIKIPARQARAPVTIEAPPTTEKKS